eukprot:3541279-Prorocentrum_lima.AAC.1
MTSSLVGSEMCIRDSLAAMPSAPANWGCANCGFSNWPRNSRCYGCQSVSYTHLTLPTICSV